MMTLLKNLTRRVLAGVTAVISLGTLTMVGASAGTKSQNDVNLVAKLPYTVKMGADITHSYGVYSAEHGAETDPALGKLTDGKFAASKSFSDDRWHKFYRGKDRTIEFELPEVKAVTGFSVAALQDNGAGLALPPWFDVYVSENGTDYMLAWRYDCADKISQSGTNRHKIVSKDMGRFKAKFVRVVFRTTVNVFIDEIEIYGNDIDGTEAKFVKAEEPKYVNAFDPGIEGCRDIVLLYCGYPLNGNSDAVQNTEEEMLYYFGYVGKDGEIKDSFFDSFMFSALKGGTPSGGSLNQYDKKFSIKSDWEYYLDSIFSEEYNCGAIERAVEKVKQATGKDDLVVSMIINLPYPTMGQKPFGDIDGDGKDEYCRNEDEQVAIYKWYFDLIEKYLAERDYKNIRLGGYYWEQESLPLDGVDIPMMHRVINMAHERGIKFFWIPLLFGDGYDMTHENGFDCAMMQPNFSFLEYSQEKCFTEIVNEIKKYGLGIEIEIHWNANTDDELLSRYYSYLNAGHALGYMKGVAHSYYQNADPGTYYHFAKSNTDKLRRAYDDTYAFVKGTYDPNNLELRSASGAVKSGRKLRRAVYAEEGYYLPSLGMASLCVVEQPAHGKVEIEGTNIYIYVPDEGYEGEDSFVVAYKSEYASSKPLTVNVTVKPDDSLASSTEDEPSETLDTSSEVSTPDREKSNTGKIAAIAAGTVAVLAIVGGVVIKPLKKKKK